MFYIKNILFTLLLVLSGWAQTYSITQCQCSQLLSKDDCIGNKNIDCSWNSTQNKCTKGVTTIPTLSESYCGQFNQQECQNTLGCAWSMKENCILFTGCTPFAQKTDTDCQHVSSRCITDGTHCVEKDACNTYQKQQPCYKNAEGAYCFWDIINNICVDADTCDKLPISLASDSDCRAQILTCTAKVGGGCQDSGSNCIYQTTQISCVWNQYQSQVCYWNGTSCVDKICEIAPSTYRTDDQCTQFLSDASCTTKLDGGCIIRSTCQNAQIQAACVKNSNGQECYWNQTDCVDKICGIASYMFQTDEQCSQFLSDGSCTTKSGGGCVTRSSCQNAEIEAACVKDSNGQQCYWNNESCVDKICINAPTNLATNQACQGFVSNCITTGSGCKEISSCNEATIQEACEKNMFGEECFWDTFCKDKICINAPYINNTHELCTSFLSTCTVNSSETGCQDRTCDNAPSDRITNEQCEAYLPGFDCVAKEGGGCVKNSTCNTLDEIACIKDINDNDCYWDNYYCKDKTCENAPLSANTHALCQAFLNKCTVNSQGKCVDFICQNISSPGICSTDFYGNSCVYKQQCSQIECTQALFQTTHLACQSFNSKCILSSKGFGCIQTPQNCSDVTTKIGCYLKLNADGPFPCVWNGTHCIDKTCSTLDKNIQTSIACAKQLQGCVSANPINGKVSGCMPLPVTCEERQSQDNCKIQGSITCIWNSVNHVCVQKTCLTASIFGTIGQLSNFSNINCSKYLTGCILNNNNNGCFDQVNNCSDLTTSFNCGNKVKIGNGDCYWNQVSKSCVDMNCKNIPLTSHLDCNGVLNTCTVNPTKLNCQAYADCSTYTIQDQCHVNAQSINCIWTGTACRDKTCNDADYTYQSTDSCIRFVVTSGVCNSIPRIQGKGCMARQTLCSSYLEKAQCFKDISNNDCVWNNNKCLQKSKVVCSEIYLDKYIDQQQDNCQLVYYKCKANTTSSACIDKVCGDYKKINGLSTGISVQTDGDCSNLDDTCTIGSAQTCQPKQDQCSSYAVDSCNNSVSKKQGSCIWHGSCYPVSTPCSSFQGTTCTSVKNTCIAATGATNTTPCTIDCTLLSKGTYADCQAEDISCSINSTGTNCINRLATCNLYGTTLINCVYSAAGLCVNDGTNCLVPTNSNCNLIKGTNLTDTICAKYSSGCIASRDGTACATQQTQCSIYDIANCTRTTTTECIGQTDDTTNICISVASNIECKNILLGNGNYTDDLCKKKNSLCGYDGISGCIIRSCDNAKKPQSFSDCNNWLNTCTYTGTGCITISAKCISQPSTACYQATEGECVGIGTLCLKKTCENAPITNSSHTDCTTFLSSCTVARIGGCVARKACNVYTSQLQCTYDVNGKSCYWSDANYTCLDFICENIDQTSNFNTHDLCNSKLSKCTVKVVNGTAINGCQTLGTCSANKFQIQCVVNSSGGLCEWNTNLTPAACVDKSCASAPNSYTFHAQCKDHVGINSCTVAPITANNLRGCIALGSCQSYGEQEQCHINASGSLCIWNGNYCADFSCQTSPLTNNTHQLCQIYKIGCTVNSDGIGCMELLNTCEQYEIDLNCVIDSSGNKCFWNSKAKQCILRTCDSPPEISSTPTLSACHYKQCIDFQGLTHFACQAININCTAGVGGYCAKIKSCADTTVKAACIKGIDGPCLWIAGVCYPYTSCKSLAWTTDQNCKQISKNCTTNGSNCIGITLCSETNVNGGCVTGYDGKCIQAVSNLGTTQTQVCKAYSSCSDAYYLTHLECQVISQSCTTNGTTGCIPLTKCSNYPQAGCHINGVSPNSNQTGVCVWDNTFQECRDQICSDLIGTTHNNCSSQMYKCTSDGTNCLLQSQCSDYPQVQCEISQQLQSVVCIWQEATEQVPTAHCRVKQCKDIINGITTQICKAQQIKRSYDCISNGTSCISKANCSTYTTKTACNSGGLDGTCVFTSSPSNDGTVEEGTCVLMTSCVSASNDQNACTTLNQKCSWTPASESGKQSKCENHTCASYQLTNNVCANFQNWEDKFQQICQLKIGICSETDPTTLFQADCYAVSNYTYTWNVQNSKCTLCTSPVVTNNSTSPNQTNNNTNTTANNTNETTESISLSFAFALFGLVIL